MQWPGVGARQEQAAMSEPARYASFMVRVWRDQADAEAPAAGAAWKGELESVQSGQTWHFQGLDELLDLLTTRLVDKPNLSNRRG